ncbi:MAG: helix-turn-helix domain-containing protein [Thermodesulfovibrionales bacterium]
MDTKKLIGLRIKELRKRRGLSQEQAAGEAGITTNHLSSIERGMENPTLDTFVRLATMFDVNLKELFDFGHQIKIRELKKMISNTLAEATEDELRLIARFITIIKN